MTNRLQAYLKEVEHYLYMNDKEEKDEIIREIQSYIQDEARSTYGEETEENVQKVIQKFGSPKEIASKYMCEMEENTLPHQKFFLLLFGVFFVVISSIYMFLISSGVNGFEFLESYSANKQLLLRILSIGVVVVIALALLLPIAIGMSKKKGNYKVAGIVYSSKKNICLADISFFRTRTRKSNITQFFASAAVLLVTSLMYIKFHTLFVISETSSDIIFKADNEVCRILSLVIIAVAALHFIYYGISTLKNKSTDGIVLSYVRFILLWAVLNVITFYQVNDVKFKNVMEDMTYMSTVYIILIVIFALDTIRRSISGSVKYKLKSR